MKKIINNKKYDTETATFVGEWDNGLYGNDINFVHEELYRKRTGEYFIYGDGGAYTRYSHSVGNGWCGGEGIIPLDYAEAREWAEMHLSADEYEAEFGEINEDDTCTTLTVSLPADVVARLRRQAQESGTTVSSIIADALANG